MKDGKQRVAASAEKGEKGERANPVRSPARKMAIAATALMPSLYQTFQCKMDGISGTSRTSTSTTVGGNGASKSGGGKKNNQQDAVECLTFLLDALHEEIIHTEAENARLAAEALAAGVNPRNASGKGSSPPLIEGLAKMSTDDFDLIPLDSRQNSLEMVIALTRQNSLSTEQKVGADTDANAAGDDDGWNTVTKSGKQKAKAVVVDAASKERADSASSASVISRLFHATLRWGLLLCYCVATYSSVMRFAYFSICCPLFRRAGLRSCTKRRRRTA